MLAIIYIILSGLFFIAAGHYSIPISFFTRDPAAIFKSHPFVGIISNIGILFWCATASICFFSFFIIAKQKRKETAWFLLFSGLLTTVLLLDDLLMFHEYIFPEHLHIPQKAVYVGYLVLTVMFFIRCWKSILQTEYVVLFLACSFFGLSTVCDVFLPQQGMLIFFEEAFKLFGIVTWTIFFIRTCFTLDRLNVFSDYS